MIDLYQPSSYLKKLVVKKSDEIFAPSDPLSIPLYPVLCSWRVSCLDGIKAPLSSDLQLCTKNGEHQQVRGWEEQEAGILSPSVLFPQDPQRLSDSPLHAAGSQEPPPPLAPAGPGMATASQYYYFQSNAVSLPDPLTPAGAFVSTPSVKSSSGTQFGCALCF